MSNRLLFKPVFLISLLLAHFLQAQETGEITGKLTDNLSKEPLVGGIVRLVGAEEFTWASTDTSGFFRLAPVPYGVHALQVRYLGYETKVITDIGVYDNKGMYVEISLSPTTQTLDEVTISAYDNPATSTDPLAVVSARGISIEETRRFAGSLGDPSRMALSYAGVNSSRGDNNDIIIRGNPAKYLQWKLEGLVIPNPNHFGVYGSSGGLLNILNSNNLGRSDFYLGAFPAHTGNALAGVFDLSLRNGSATHYKHSLETSLIGLSVSSEGPLKITEGGSYIVNYRYSTLGLMKKLGVFYQAPDYQDLTFKVNLPTKEKGIFTLYGLTGLGTWVEEEFFRKIDSTQFHQNPAGNTVYGFDEIAAENLKKYNVSVFGIKHILPIGTRHTLTNHVNYSRIFNAPRSSDINRADFSVFLKNEGRFTHHTFRYQPELTTYINEHHSLHMGATLSLRSFHSKLIEGYPDLSTKTILESTDNTFLGQSFVSYKNTSIHKLKIVAGLHYTFFALNRQQVLEPRLGLDYQVSDKTTLAFATGMHSTIESPEVYLMYNDTTGVTSRHLQMSRSWQNVISYKRKLGQKLFLTAELYAQHLFDIPIAADSSNLSLINEDISLVDIALVNQGKGLNYGMEVTLEKFFSQSYYFLFTASLFQSEYKLMERFYRKTKHSNSYVFNILGGKEFTVKTNQFFGINLRANFSGGKPYIPVLLEASIASNQEVRDEKRAYFKQLPPYIGIDFSMNYRWILSKTSHEIKLDIFRLFEQNFYDEVYVPERLNRNGSISPATVRQVQYGEGQTSTTVLPVLYYKLTF